MSPAGNGGESVRIYKLDKAVVVESRPSTPGSFTICPNVFQIVEVWDFSLSAHNVFKLPRALQKHLRYAKSCIGMVDATAAGGGAAHTEQERRSAEEDGSSRWSLATIYDPQSL